MHKRDVYVRTATKDCPHLPQLECFAGLKKALIPVYTEVEYNLMEIEQTSHPIRWEEAPWGNDNWLGYVDYGNEAELWFIVDKVVIQ